MEYAAQSSTPGLLEVNAPLVEEQARHRALLDIEAATEATARAFRAASVVLAVSLEVADYVRRCPGAPRAVVLPNGVDPERIRPDVEPSRRGRPGSFTFGFVGTLKPWHGLHTLVQAFASVRRRHSNVRLLIVGDGPERERVASSAREAGCAHAVEFTGAVDPADVPALLTSMDAGVAPYPKLEHCYFSPLKLYEYMAAALPVVASDIGQVAEVIQHDVTGLLCPPGDARALANAFVRLMEDPNLRHTLGRNARAAVQREHTWSAVTARILELAGQNVRATEAGVRG
jgi:glycosyltransferase involved in cell wall biosynthesis